MTNATESSSAYRDLSESDSDQIYRMFVQLIAAEANGRPNALTARRLCERLELGANGDRLLRVLARRAREENVLVCADDNGYFIPATPEEAQQTIGRLRSQGQQMLDSARMLERLAERQFSELDQMSLL